MTKFGPYPPAPSTVRFQLRTQLSGGPLALTRFFMKYTGVIGAVDATTLLTTLATSWNTHIAPQTGAQYTLTGTALDDLGSRTGVTSELPVSHPGSNIGGGVGAAQCMVVSALVPLKYRGGHSRVYLPGLAASGLADINTWSGTFQATVFTAWTTMLSDLANSPPVAVGALSQVTVRYISSNKADFPPPPPSTFPALLPTPLVLTVSSWRTNPQMASQRRRNQQGS